MANMMNLRELYLNDELTGAINRVVESVNHEFVLQTLLETFRSHDLGSVRQLLNAKDIDSLDQIDAENITARLQYLLQIKNAEDYRSGLTDSHVKEIRSYLKRLDLIGEVEIRDIETGTKKSHDVFMQPGLRYSQAKDLISVVLDDPSIRFRSASEKTAIAAFFEADIKGRMMDEIVLYDTSVRYPDYEVFKLQYSQGEIDMVVYDPETGSCSLYEIKHSETIDARQVRHLTHESLIRKIEEYYGPIVAKNVIYRGRTITGEDGVDYVNVNDFLSDRQDLRVVFGDNDQSPRFDL